jgi:hypothetical protein
VEVFSEAETQMPKTTNKQELVQMPISRTTSKKACAISAFETNFVEI